MSFCHNEKGCAGILHMQSQSTYPTCKSKLQGLIFMGATISLSSCFVGQVNGRNWIRGKGNQTLVLHGRNSNENYVLLIHIP